MADLFYPVRMDIADFYDSVKLLSASINSSDIDWQDEKYKELAGKIQNVAASSSMVLQAGERCKVALNMFERIVQDDV